jgi:hypothetical protein
LRNIVRRCKLEEEFVGSPAGTGVEVSSSKLIVVGSISQMGNIPSCGFSIESIGTETIVRRPKFTSTCCKLLLTIEVVNS